MRMAAPSLSALVCQDKLCCVIHRPFHSTSLSASVAICSQLFRFSARTPRMQWLLDFIARWFCTCGARQEQPPNLPISSALSHHSTPITTPSSPLSPPSPSSSVVRRVLDHIPPYASPRSASPSPSTCSHITYLPTDVLPPHPTHAAVPSSQSSAVPMKAPPPRPPPSISPNVYQARSSASSSQHAQPTISLPAHAKAPPPAAYQIYASQIERRLGLHWAGYAFLTFSQYSEGWQTWYTDDYTMVFFYNRATGTSRWSPPPLPEDTDAGGSTGGT